MKVLLAGAIALLATTIAACTPPAATSSNALIEERNAAFSQAFASGSGEAVAAFYSDDAVVMPDGANPVEGREAIAQFWQGFIDSGAKRIELTTDDTTAAGSTISERGRFRVFDATDATLGEGKYIVVWTLQNGDWLLRWDIWNANGVSAPAQ